jgi:hypothetical protein
MATKVKNNVPATAGSKTAPITEQTSNKAINAKISAIRQTGAKLNDAIHETGLLVMQHSLAFNDCTGAARLIDALPMTHRRALLIRWFEMFSPIIVEKKKGVMNAHLARDGSPKHKKYDIDGARATRFDALPEVQNEPGLFTIEDLNEAIDRLVKRAERLLKDNRVAEADVDKVKTRVTGLKMVATINGTPPVANEAGNDDGNSANQPERKRA